MMVWRSSGEIGSDGLVRKGWVDDDYVGVHFHPDGITASQCIHMPPQLFTSPRM
jgi:hypothetical protein